MQSDGELPPTKRQTDELDALIQRHAESGTEQELACYLAEHSGLPEEQIQLRLAERPTMLGTAGAGSARGSSARRFGKYELIDELGRGGMGVVYRARDSQLGRQVALKVMGAGADRELIARFEREAQNMALLRHPNIVGLLEFGEADEQRYLAMELVDGVSLAEHLDGARIDPREAATLIVPVARGVQHAHDHGVIHRDLKPANIMIDREGTPQVLDFGLARGQQLDASLTQTGQVLGTPHYMAPEQTTGDSAGIGPHTDIYGLGAVLYELLTLHTPFDSPDVLELLRLVQREDPRPPRQLNPRVHVDLETICLKAMEKSPARRYESATALADDLQRFLDSEPIHARPPSLADRVRKLVRRRWRALVVGLSLLLAVGGTLLGSLVLYPRWQAEKRRQQQQRAHAAERRALESARDEIEAALSGGQLAIAISRGLATLEKHAEFVPASGEGDRLEQGRVQLSRAHLKSAADSNVRRSQRHLALAYHHAPDSKSGKQALFEVARSLRLNRRFDRARRLYGRLLADPDPGLRARAEIELVRIDLLRGELRAAHDRLVGLIARRDLPSEITARGARLLDHVRLLHPIKAVPLGAYGQYPPLCVTLADMDGDGRAEVLSLSPEGELLILRHLPDKSKFEPLLSAPLIRLDNIYAGRLAVGDINGDGRPDVVAGFGDPRRGITTLTLVEQVGASWRTRPLKWKAPPLYASESRGSIYWDLAIADLTGDGRADILVNQGWYGYHSGVAMQLEDGRFEYLPLPSPVDEDAPQAGVRAFTLLPGTQGAPPTLVAGLEERHLLAAYRYDGKGRMRALGKGVAFDTHGLAAYRGELIAQGRLPGKRGFLHRLSFDGERFSALRAVPVPEGTRPGRRSAIRPVLLPLRRGRRPDLVVAWASRELVERRVSRGLLIGPGEPDLPLGFLEDSALLATGDVDGDGTDELAVEWRNGVHLLGVGDASAPGGSEAQGETDTAVRRLSAPALELGVAQDLLAMSPENDAEARQRLNRIITRYPEELEAELARLELARCEWRAGRTRRANQLLAEVQRRAPQLAGQALRMAYQLQLQRADWHAALRTGRRLRALGQLTRIEQDALESDLGDLSGFSAARDVLEGWLDLGRYGFAASSPWLLERLGAGWLYRDGRGTESYFGMPLDYSGGSFELSVELRFERLDFDTPFLFGLFSNPDRPTFGSLGFSPRLVWGVKVLRSGEFWANSFRTVVGRGAALPDETLRPFPPGQWFRLTVRYLPPIKQAQFTLRAVGARRPLWRLSRTVNLVLPPGTYDLGAQRIGGRFASHRRNRIHFRKVSLRAGPGTFRARRSFNLLRRAYADQAMDRVANATRLYGVVSKRPGRTGRRVPMALYRTGLLLLRAKRDPQQAATLRGQARAALEMASETDQKLLYQQFAREANRIPPEVFEFFLDWAASKHPLAGNLPGLSRRNVALARSPELAHLVEQLVVLRLLQRLNAMGALTAQIRHYRISVYRALDLNERAIELMMARNAASPEDLDGKLELLDYLIQGRDPRARTLGRRILAAAPRNHRCLQLLLTHCLRTGDSRGLLELIERLRKLKIPLQGGYQRMIDAARAHLERKRQESNRRIR